MGRVAVGLVLGCLLGVLGLPRLDLHGPVAGVVLDESAPLTATAVTTAVVAQPESGSVVAPAELTEPTAAAPAEPTAAPAPTVATPAGPRVMLDAHVAVPLADWPNDPRGPAWFADGTFHLAARQPGRFVAVGVPLLGPIGDAVISARFRKLAGPAGGGYGLIVRDQSQASTRDGFAQDGQYLVLGVGDRGDIGVWQRDQTHWIDIVPWTHSEVVHRDTESNTLVVATRGASLHFEVNGEVVADFTYAAVPSQGGVGIFVGGDLNQVALESLRIEE